MREIPGYLRIVELANSGRVLRRYAVNFENEAQALEYATDYLCLEAPDLDMPLAWNVDGRRIIAQVQR